MFTIAATTLPGNNTKNPFPNIEDNQRVFNAKETTINDTKTAINICLN